MAWRKFGAIGAICL